MNRFQQILAIATIVSGAILLSLDIAGATIHMRGADSIAGAILFGCGVLALRGE